MKYSEAKQGRIFIIRLYDGEIVHDEIERFAKEKSIKAAALIAIGGADKKSKLVVGPKNGRATPVFPMEHILSNVHEIAGVGTLFPDDEGNPLLHMHTACGRESSTITGCIRKGVKVWQIMEIILFELVGSKAVRIFEENIGFKLLSL